MSKGYDIEWEIKTYGHEVKSDKCQMGHNVEWGKHNRYNLQVINIEWEKKANR
jgi:hypothetical protein